MPIFDIEGDGLFPTKLHVLSYQDGPNISSTPNYDVMSDWFCSQDILIGHNIQRYDIPHIERLLGITVKARLVDTLALSWYLYPTRPQHGLDSWGEELGVKKPKIDNWDSLTYEEYAHRCEEDVKINTLLWQKMVKHLSALYEVTEDQVINLPIIHYLEFKLDCAREQERSKWRVDKELATSALAELNEVITARTEALREVMPKVPEMATKNKPAKMFKKDGSPSAAGLDWHLFLAEKGLPEDTEGSVEYIKNLKEPNPASHVQVKDWLFGLGWEPSAFKYDKNDDGSVRAIPQIRVEGEEGKELCPSVKALIPIEPGIQELEGLTVAQHRAAILEGFLSNMDEEGFVKAEINGLTNTLRFKHKTVVNLPGVSKPWGGIVRGCLIARDGFELVGSDMSALENKVSDHYIYPLDPDYVESKNTKGYDAHIKTAVVSGLMTKDEEEFFTWYKGNH